MDKSSVEVRLFTQHLAQWLGAFSQRQIPECRAAIDDLRLHGRALCADPEFRRLFEVLAAESGCRDPDLALGAMCSFLSALAGTSPYSHYR